MTPVKIWKLALSGILGLILGIQLFFPWGAVGDYIMAKTIAGAAENGIYATVQKSFARGILDKELIYLGLQADFPVFRADIKEVAVDPLLLHSIVTATPSCSVTLGRGTIKPVTGRELEWKSGTAYVSAGKTTVYIKDIELKGDFSAEGFMEISRENGTIVHAKLAIKVPEEMDRPLQMLSAAGIIRASRVKTGEWKIER